MECEECEIASSPLALMLCLMHDTVDSVESNTRDISLLLTVVSQSVSLKDITLS